MMTEPNISVYFSSTSTFLKRSIEEEVVGLIQTNQIKKLPLPRALLYAMHMKGQKESRLNLGRGIMHLFEGQA